MGQVVMLASGRSMLCPLGLSASRILSRRKYQRNSRGVPHSYAIHPNPSPEHRRREIAWEWSRGADSEPVEGQGIAIG